MSFEIKVDFKVDLKSRLFSKCARIPLLSTGDQNQLINSGIWFKKSKEAVNMINLQFDHNKLTYKNCLQFLGLVIVIQIKAMN